MYSVIKKKVYKVWLNLLICPNCKWMLCHGPESRSYAFLFYGKVSSWMK